MFKIKENTIHITRGDKGVIELAIDNYTFSVGDTIEFRVYEKRALDKLPVLSKVVTVEKEAATIDIELSSEDTKIGEPRNAPREYWYEIELNDHQTIIGYDEDGAKVLMLYPEGVEADDTK